MGARPGTSIYHLAFIPDGNRRWASAHHLPALKGHESGIDRMGEVLKWCRALHIPMVSFWAFSTENLHRDKKEVEGLFRAFETRLQKVIKEGDFAKYGVRMRFIGDRSLFPTQVQIGMQRVENETAKNKKYFVNLFVGYGGRPELVAAAKRLVVKYAHRPKSIDEKVLASCMWTSDIPDPDLIIRTSGEQRLSGFLPFQSAYSELYFCKKLWPDLKKSDVAAAVREFKKRKRRWGK
ncbi:Tritrans,polycis-undecaprenyl-diphosphate synthase (GGDP specific) [uncultured archaeon]|nr:Tritrans,polycis-undecaprenyl-diphosphate synthase (GGDP specific) [uncultured archaeon]